MKRWVDFCYHMCHNSYLHKGALHRGDLTFVLKYNQNYIQNSVSSPNQKFEIPHRATLKHCHSTPNCLSSEILNQDSLSSGQSHLLSQLSHSFIPTTLIFRLHRKPVSPTDYFYLSAFFCLHFLLPPPDPA